MYAFNDHIAGKAITIVYNAPQLPQPADAHWWAHGRAVRSFAKDTEAKTLLAVAGPTLTTWRAGGQTGVSLSAAIEGWLEQTETGNGVVLVPLDERIYSTRCEDGLIVSEHVLPPDKSVELLTQWLNAGDTVYGFHGGHQGARVEPHVELEPLPFDLWAYRFRPILPSFAQQRLWHPGFAVIALLLIALPSAWWVFEDRAAESARALQAQIRAQQRTTDIRSADFSGADSLALLWDTLKDPALVSLVDDGLQQVTFNAAEQLLVYRGDATGAYPRSAVRFAERHSAHFELHTDGWSISQLAGPVAAYYPVDEFEHKTLLGDLYSASHRVQVAITGVDTSDSDRITETFFELQLPDRLPLIDLSRLFTERPYAVSTFSCDFNQWIVSRCVISGSVKGTTT